MEREKQPAPPGPETDTAELTLRSVARKPPVTVAPDSSVRDAILRMQQMDCDYLVVVDSERYLPLGLVTLGDLVQAIVFEQDALEQPVVALMTGAPFTLPADAPTHRATVLMSRRKLRHVILVEPDGRLCNVVSRADLFGLRGGGAEQLAELVADAADVDEMARAADAIRQQGAQLFQAGRSADAVCQWMSALNDMVAIRVIELIEDEYDLPPVPWGWMVFGSEGRLEQTFSTDQDNGLIFLPPRAEDTAGIREAFLPFARAVNRGLNACGFTLCRGNIMAANPAWCLSLDEWKARFQSWMETPDPEALLHSTIFFDFRPLYGNAELADELRTWLLPQPARHSRFLRLMAEEALTCMPPLGWANNFTYDGGPEFPHTMDLKLHGARPFVDAARIWSLKHGVWATNTADRLRAVASITGQNPSETAAEVEAFNLVQRFRIQQQLATDDPGMANRLDPEDLNELTRLMLKEAFKQAKKIQLRLKLEHGL